MCDGWWMADAQRFSSRHNLGNSRRESASQIAGRGPHVSLLVWRLYALVCLPGGRGNTSRDTQEGGSTTAVSVWAGADRHRATHTLSPLCLTAQVAEPRQGRQESNVRQVSTEADQQQDQQQDGLRVPVGADASCFIPDQGPRANSAAGNDAKLICGVYSAN